MNHSRGSANQRLGQEGRSARLLHVGTKQKELWQLRDKPLATKPRVVLAAPLNSKHNSSPLAEGMICKIHTGNNEQLHHMSRAVAPIHHRITIPKQMFK